MPIVLMVAVVAATISACGKKGPPLAPIAHVPAAVDQIAARRVGGDVYVTLTVPGKNIDGTMPADVRRVDVYAVTAVAPPPRGRFLESADLVATVTVAPAPDRTARNPRPVSAADGTPQAMPVTLRDRLRPEALVARPAPAPVLIRGRRPDVEGLAASAPRTTFAFPRRYYMAIAFSERGRPGPQGTVVELPLMQLPESPGDLRVTYDVNGVTVMWPPSGGLIGFITSRALPMEPAPFDEAPPAAATAAAAASSASDVLPGPTRYNVYRELAPDPLAPPPAASDTTATNSTTRANGWSAVPPLALTTAPIELFTFSDAVEFDRERCYEVRAVRGTPPQVVEGEPSPRACVTPIDTFPPAPPAGVTAVAAQGVISLLWEPNIEVDLGGYVVLRGRAGDATLVQLTDTPIAEARFTDKTVMGGVRYVYAVRAVDTRLPVPNMSDASAPVEETAR